MEKYIDIDFAKLDLDRKRRRGYSEAIYCECKDEKQIIEIFKTFVENGQNVIGTRASQKQYLAVKKIFPETNYDEDAKILTYVQKPVEKIGKIAVCAGGTGDIPIAKEAVLTAEFYGSRVDKYFDVGISCLDRLLINLDKIKAANIVIAAAGMEGALASVIAGLVDIPVIALPTSIGYGASLNGLSALLTMLNSCSEGIGVVNIDNGFGAGYLACQINRLITKGRK